MVVAEQTGLENYAALCKSRCLVKKETHAKILSHPCAGLLAGFLRSGNAPARINPCACRLQPNICDCDKDSWACNCHNYPNGNPYPNSNCQSYAHTGTTQAGTIHFGLRHQY